MKQKFVLAFMCLLFSVAGQAQHARHMDFLGIPIDGTLQSFESKLPAKGFKKVVWKGEILWEGTFLNEAVRLQMLTDNRTGKVSSVVLATQKESSGQDILGEVERWKSKIGKFYHASFYTRDNGFYAADIQSPSGRVGVGCLYIDASSDSYVVMILIIDGENARL